MKNANIRNAKVYEHQQHLQVLPTTASVRELIGKGCTMDGTVSREWITEKYVKRVCQNCILGGEMNLEAYSRAHPDELWGEDPKNDQRNYCWFRTFNGCDSFIERE